jgi:hypothetical protein
MIEIRAWAVDFAQLVAAGERSKPISSYNNETMHANPLCHSVFDTVQVIGNCIRSYLVTDAFIQMAFDGLCLPKTSSEMTRGWSYGNEAAMVAFLTQLLLAIRSRFTRRAGLEAENLILRQQLVVLRRKFPRRVRLSNIDRLLLVWLYRLYPALLDAIIVVQPETAIRWHRRGFRCYWRWKSRHVGGRPRIDSEIRALIRR